MVAHATPESPEASRVGQHAVSIDHLPDAIAIVADDGTISHANRRLAAMFGYAPDELVNQRIEALMPERFRRVHVHQRNRFHKKPHLRPNGDRLRLRGKRKDGSEFSVDVALNALPSANGRSMLASIRDLSPSIAPHEEERPAPAATPAHVKPEPPATSAIEQHAVSIDYLPDAIAIVAADGTISHANKQLAAMFGYAPDELVDKRVEVLMPERFRRVHVHQRAGFHKNPHLRPNGDGLQLRGKRKDGSEFPIDVALNALPSADGRAVVASIRDVSQRVALQEQERQAKLMFAAVVDASPVAIVCLSPDRRVMVWNPIAEEIFQYAANEVMGQPSPLVAPDDQDEAVALFERALAGEKSRQVEVQRQRKDGSLVWVSLSCAAVYDPHGKISGVAYALQDISVRQKSEADLLRLATTDVLTGLVNRRVFFEKLDFAVTQARRTQLACAVILFDIDNFKEVNDLFGHKTGDDVLVAVTRAVGAQLRESDVLARLGGDEFAILAPNLKSAAAAMEIAEKIGACVSSIGEFDDARVSVSISIGISVFPMDQGPAEQLVAHADIALYRSKTTSKGTVTYFDARMDGEIRAHHTLKRNMPEDIANGRFHLEFQPIVDAHTRQIVGAEGLARWCDRENRIITPAQFIPIAEESSVISRLGKLLLDDACHALKQWRDDGKEVVPISLNISPIQLREEGFAQHLVGAIERVGLDPRLINIEVTESAIVKNVAATRSILELARSHGIGVHIDDFGTGYSSLSMLRDLPLDTLKIDQSFVRDIGVVEGAESIAQAIVDLSGKFGLRTIAEGVESEEQAVALREIGVDFLQGYYFSRPVTAERFEQWLDPARAVSRAS